MKTKSMIAALVLLLMTATTSNAQNTNERGRARMNPTELYTRMADRLAKEMKLEDDKAETFKVLYLDYQTARQNAANPKGENAENERIDMRKLTDAQATELIQKRFQTQEAQLAVDKEYYSKFLEILTPAQAAQIYIQRGGGRGGMNGQGGRGGRFGGGGFGGGGFGSGRPDAGGFGGGDF